MKRGWISILFLFLLLTPVLTLAQNQTQQNLTNIKEKLNAPLEKEVQIPESIQFFARALFGIKVGEPITFQQFVILIAVWLIFFLTFADIIFTFSTFNRRWISFAISFCIVTIMGVLGLTLHFVSFFNFIGSIFGALESWPIITSAIVIILLVAILIVVKSVLGQIATTKGIGESEIKGFKAGINIKSAEKFGEKITKELGKEVSGRKLLGGK